MALHLEQEHGASLSAAEYISAREFFRYHQKDPGYMDTKDLPTLSDILYQDLFLGGGIQNPLVSTLTYLRSQHDALSEHIHALQRTLSSILFPVGPLCPSSLSVPQNNYNKHRLLYLNSVIKRAKFKACLLLVVSIYQLRSLLPQEVLLVILSNLLLLNPPTVPMKPKEHVWDLAALRQESPQGLYESSAGIRLLRLALQSP